MGEQIQFQAGLDPEIRAFLGYQDAAEAVRDERGLVVRSTPMRQTLAMDLPDGRRLFRKLRQGRRADARAEWLWLATLAELGFHVPGRVFLAESGTRSAIGLLEVPGQPMHQMFQEQWDAARAFAIDTVAPMVRRLHDHGLFYRDLYWNHLYATTLARGAPEPALIDVERVIRPRIRMHRWRVKDLAGLVSSLPRERCLPATDMLRFLRSYHGGALPPWHRLARQVLRKARKIRDHKPKWGESPLPYGAR